jgi:hypothetical protein
MCSSTSAAMMRSNDHAPGDGGRVLELGGVGVEGDDDRTTSHRLERVASTTAAEVEERLPIAQIEPFEVDRQHQAAVVSRSSRRAR